jgi:hypothetical protein
MPSIYALLTVPRVVGLVVHGAHTVDAFVKDHIQLVVTTFHAQPCMLVSGGAASSKEASCLNACLLAVHARCCSASWSDS